MNKADLGDFEGWGVRGVGDEMNEYTKLMMELAHNKTLASMRIFLCSSTGVRRLIIHPLGLPLVSA
jgi:flavoprotein